MIAWVSCVGKREGPGRLKRDTLFPVSSTSFVRQKELMIKAKIVKNSLFLKWED